MRIFEYLVHWTMLFSSVGRQTRKGVIDIVDSWVKKPDENHNNNTMVVRLNESLQRFLIVNHMKKKIFSAAFAAYMTSPLVIVPTIVLRRAIAINIVTAPAQAKNFTKVKDIAKEICELGACWAIVERVTEYLTTSQAVPESLDIFSGKDCNASTGGSVAKIGETRTIVSKVCIR